MAEKINTTAHSGPGGPGGPGSMGTGEKSKNAKKAFKQFFGYIGKYKWAIIAAGIMSVAGSVLNLIGPNKLSQVTDLITEGLSSSIDIPAVVKITSLLAILYSIGFLLNYSQGYIMATISQRITQNMRRDISLKINRLPLRYFDSHSTGDVLSRVTNDVDTVGQTMNQSLSTIISSVAMLLGSMLMMFLTNVIMAVTGILACVIGFVLMLLIISKSQKYYMEQQRELGGLNGQVEETYSGHDVVKVYNATDDAKADFHSRNESLYNCAWKSQFLSGLMMPMMSFIGNLSYVVVCIAGALLAVKGTITFGTIVAFMLYIRQFTLPLQNISQAISSVQGMAAASERVFEFLEEKEMEPETDIKAKLDNVNGNIEFDHIKFGYTQTVIHDFSFKAKAGQKVAIVGPTGAGKTTIVNLLMRFYEPNSGSISIDGVPINTISRENVHSLFGMVLQDTWMFEGTMRENLVFNKLSVTDEQLDKVCKAAGLTELIHQLPHGYDTYLGDNANLSAGQKQLVTIARAMVENAPLLILDEATSSVDTETEQKVQSAMDTLTQGRTGFVIAHRLSTIKNADCILVIKDGDIIESGRHNELLSKGGFYAELYNSQFDLAS